MQYLLGCDFGGSAAKATLLDAQGRVAATAQREYPTYYPKPGWAEQDPQESYDALVAIIREVLEKSGIQARDIAALALDGATHTAVLLDERDRLARRSIYWTDKRAGEQARRLLETHGDEIVRLSYNTPSSLWTLPQLLWLKEREPETHSRIRRVLSMRDYLRFRLTGDFVTDSIEAMGFMLLDVAQGQWSPFLCGLCGLAPGQMPGIVEPTCRLSPLTAQAMEDTGLCASTMVIAGATDTALEVYASGAIAPGQATVKLATAGRICPVTPKPVVDRQLVCYRHVVEGLWYPGTATKSCATSNRWYRDTFGGEYETLSAQAAEIGRGSNNLFFHPFLQGEITPYLDDQLCASFTGITASHTKAHFNRAVLEGVAYSMKDCFEVLRGMGIAPQSAAIIGGGAKSPLWRQIMADMLGIPLQVVAHVDSSLGSAMLAGVAGGIFASHEQAVEKCVRVKETVLPDPEGQAFYEEHFPLYKDIVTALTPIYHRMGKAPS